MRNKTNQNVQAHRGDTVRLRVEFMDSNDEAVDVTGCTIVYTCYRDSFTAPVITKTGGSDFAVSGPAVEVVLTPADTTLSGNHMHKLVLTDGIGQVFTLVLGQIRFASDVLSDVAITLTALLDELYTRPYLVDLRNPDCSAFFPLLFFDEVLG